MEGAGPVGVLLALTGDDVPLVRCLDAAGTGLQVVRRCGDLPELLSAGMAGLASLVALDSRLDDVDRTVLERLERAGLGGVLLVPAGERERWTSTGWPVLDDDAPVDAVRTRLQGLARGTQDQDSASGADAGGNPAAEPRETDQEQPDDPAAAGTGDAIDDEWARLDAADHAHAPSGAGATPDRPAERLDGASGSPSGSSAGAVREVASADGRLLIVWGPHGAPGRTTVAASLAHGLARTGGSLLVDADLEAPGLVQVLGLPDDSSGLASAARLATHGRLDDEGLARLMTPVSDGVALLSGLGRAGRWRELPPVAMREVWDRARRAAAWIVVDVAGGAVDDEVDDFTLEPGRGSGRRGPPALRRRRRGGRDRGPGRRAPSPPAPRRQRRGPPARRAARGRRQPGAGLRGRALTGARRPRDPRALRRARRRRRPAGRPGRRRPLPARGDERPRGRAGLRPGSGPRSARRPRGSGCGRRARGRPGEGRAAAAAAGPGTTRAGSGGRRRRRRRGWYGLSRGALARFAGPVRHTGGMRIYLPATASDLAADAVTVRRAHAVTKALVAALPEEDEEGLEVSASLCAADSSLVLLAEPASSDEPDRRVVIAADVSADAVTEVPAGEDVLPGTVEVTEPVGWDDVAAVLIDEADAEADVRAARAGDEKAFERAAEADLLWYDVSERAALAAELR